MKKSFNKKTWTEFIELENNDYTVVSINKTENGFFISANVKSLYFPRSRMFCESKSGNLFYKIHNKNTGVSTVFLIKQGEQNED